MLKAKREFMRNLLLISLLSLLSLTAVANECQIITGQKRKVEAQSLEQCIAIGNVLLGTEEEIRVCPPPNVPFPPVFKSDKCRTQTVEIKRFSYRYKNDRIKAKGLVKLR